MQRCWSDSVSQDLDFVFCVDKIYLRWHRTHHFFGSAMQRCWFNTVSHCMLLVFIKRSWFSVWRFIFFVTFRSNISLLSLKTSFVRHCIAATLKWRSCKLYVSWIPHKNMIQCQKIYILRFVSTKYISVDTEYRLWFSVGRFIYCVSFFTKYISVVNEYIISASSICSYVDLRFC